MPNRLADETSPYLLQHAENPVDWYPWGDEALERARTEKKPIFLSVGYSACHWCHVMEHESFENAAIAAYLNDHFVNIKVDREERPDIDNIYMEAVQLMTGQGGWPMSVFLTPGLEPFYAGTYFPPEDRWGRPGFMSVLQQLVAVWEGDEERIAQVTGQVLARMKQSAGASSSGALSRELVSAAVAYFDRVFDDVDGGFGDAPKFPPSAAVQLLMHASQDDDASDAARTRALDMAEQTLVHMAMGGIYDHVGGGFHRYAVDARWLVPHFEKMLYDNALLICAYTEAFRLTGRPLYERVVRETIAWLDREMTLQTQSGHALYSSQDADSEGEEGKFFVWSPEEIAAVLGPEASQAGEFWGVSADGNFEGRTILNRLHLIEDDWTLGFEELPDWVDQIRAMLHAARAERVSPGTDHKVLAGWNGLAITALARAGAVFAEPEWRDRAASIATFVLERMVDADGNLLRTFKDDRARFPAYMDDYAFMTAGLLDLFETRGEIAWLEHAIALGERADELFWDDGSGGYFFTAEHHRDLIVRQKERFDGATPSSNSIAAMNLLRLSVLTGRTELRHRADRLLQGFVDVMQRAPRGAAQFLVALDFHLRGPREFVFFTPEGGVSLALDAWGDALGHAVVVDVPQGGDQTWAALVPLVRDRAAVDGKPTVYICRDGACDLPQHAIGARSGPPSGPGH